MLSKTRFIRLAKAGTAFRLLLAGSALLCGLLATSGAAQAATITVTSNADGPAPGPVGSLRRAVNDAAAGDTINFGVSGTITLANGELDITKNLTIAGPGTNNLALSGDNASRIFLVASGVTLNLSSLSLKNGQVGVSSGTGGAIENDGGSVGITNCILNSNSAGNFGGAIYNTGTVTLTGSTLSNNTSADGGAIFNNGTLSISNSTLSSNAATSDGGAIFNYNNSLLTMTGSTLNGNTAGIYGGGIYNYGIIRLSTSTLSANSGGVYNVSNATISSSTLNGNAAHYSSGGAITNSGAMSVMNSTIAGNTGGQPTGAGAAGAAGGIVSSAGNLSVMNSTIASNTGGHGGYAGQVCGSQGCTSQPAGPGGPGGILVSGGTVTIQSTIIASNMGGQPGASGAASGVPDVQGSVTSNGYNLIGNSTGSSGFTATGDQLNVNPKLDSNGLKNNGGPTLTIALLNGSPAVDKGKTNLATDQRGKTRPFDDPGATPAPGGDNSDIGAFEKQTSVTNSAPVTANDSYLFSQGYALSVAAPGVLGNDTDAEHNPLTAALVQGPSHGTLSLNPDGSFTYTPTATYIGTDSFTYRANDGASNSNVATVTLADNLGTLTVTASPSTFSEGAGPNASTGTVTRSGSLTQALTVTLRSSDPREFTVPQTVTIPAGQNSVSFSLAAIDDNVVDGSQGESLRANAPGYAGGKKGIVVLDNDGS